MQRNLLTVELEVSNPGINGVYLNGLCTRSALSHLQNLGLTKQLLETTLTIFCMYLTSVTFPISPLFFAV